MRRKKYTPNRRTERKQSIETNETVKSLQAQIEEKDKTIADLSEQLNNELKRNKMLCELLEKEKAQRIEDLNQWIEERRQDTEMMYKLEAANGAVLSLVKDNIKTIALHERLKNSKGKESPNYIQGIDNRQLVQEYINNGYKLSNEIAEKYISKYGITYGALRLRLIKAGVWKDRKNKELVPLRNEA